MHQTIRKITMTRQSVSFTEPNNDWIQSKVDSNEYKNKSELINELVRQARVKQEKLEFIRAKLIQAEQKGFVSQSEAELLAEIKKGLKFGTKVKARPTS